MLNDASQSLSFRGIRLVAYANCRNGFLSSQFSQSFPEISKNNWIMFLIAFIFNELKENSTSMSLNLEFIWKAAKL